ncbi:MAG: PAS domain S-box protein [Ignavibacteriaceae bacterium]|jgi:PAS domain S-box-containing protein|nr:PAS domain S-box protein [Ignavibacteriaceae bacterium]MCU0413652.1 PAS domain S-box protein [Ignavibacteriaceae bacterium]
MDDLLLKKELLNIDLLFGQLWEISVDGMRLIDEDGNILLVNDAFCKIFQMEREEVLGKPFSIVYADDEHEKALKAYQRDIRKNELKTLFERENTLWNGKKSWLEFSNSFLTLPDDSKLTLSIIKDISKRKKSELELRESESKFKMLFNNANDAVFVTQFSNEKSYGDFIEVNEVACRRLGYTKEEFLQLSPSAIVSQKSIIEFNLKTEQLLKDGHVIYDIVHRAKDRKLIPVEVNSHLFIYNDKPTVLSIARDITERKQAEEKLKRTSKLLRELATHLQSIREEERTMIAQEIHDELGQVLTALKIQVSLLANKLDKNQQPLKEKINSLSDMIDASVESVQKISSKLRPGILDELGLIAAIEWQTEEFEKMTNIKCSLVLPGEELLLEKSKSTAIFRIFQEALTNIARHAKATQASISLLQHQSIIYLEIQDNGRGITPEQEKDFNSLGIHGMKERAMVFNGQVYVEGITGKGTIVKVEIPID